MPIILKLSILLAGIRPHNWLKLYNSIEASCHSSWELVIVSPNSLPDNLKDKANIKIFQDFGSPLRCYQRALVESSGKYVSWCSDDGVFLPDALDIALEWLEMASRSVIVGKYNEGAVNPQMNDIAYYYFKNHDATNVPYVPDGCLMLMEGVVPRDLMIEVGGWDAATFEVCPMGFIDLSVRLHRIGITFIFQEEMLFTCSHMPGHEGDHGPIHDAQTLHDEFIFNKIYRSPQSVERIFIDINNWKKAPDWWVRRFGPKKL